MIIHSNLIKAILILWIVSISSSQVKMKIVEHVIFPEELKALRLKPTFINWSLGDKFLLLDFYNSELFELNSLGQIKLSYGINRRNHRYGELIWAGISPSGIQVVDRLENEVLTLDFNLNPIQNTSLEHNIFPELAQVDPWGRLFLLSSTYNGVFIYENDYVARDPFIDFSKYFHSNYCVKDFAINGNGEISLLGCDGFFHQFSQNGMKEISIPIEINNPEFLSSLRDDWLVLNRLGRCFSIKESDYIDTPKIDSQIIDVATLNKSVVFLTKDHILVLNVE